MNHDQYDKTYIEEILRDVKSIAVVGASANHVRPSFLVVKYLVDKGYGVFPINPGHAGGTILGLPVFSSLNDLPGPVDMVDIFRNSEVAGSVVDEALALDPLPKVIWMQLTVRNDKAAARAEAKGVKIVMDRCPKIEYGRLSGEIGWMGVNSRLVSSKRPRLRAGGFQHLEIRNKD